MYLSDVQTELGEATRAELAEQFGTAQVVFVQCDVTDAASVERLLERAEELLDAPLHCLVNNAGVMGEKEGWRLCLDINLRGVVHGTEAALRRLARDRGGRGGVVVNIASILGLFCAVQPKDWQYNVSKSAVVTLSRCLGNKVL